MKFKVVLSSFLILILIFSCKPKPTANLEEMARRSSRPEAVMVKTVMLEPSTFYHELISNGKVSSLQKAVVPFRVNDIIKELYIKNGQKVNKGDLLAVIEDFDYAVKLTQARQGLEKASINFKDDLLSNYFTTDTTDIDPAKIRISRIRSGLNDAIIALEVAQYNFKNTRIYAPISGAVANLEALPHNPSQNYQSLCTILFDEIITVEFQVIESEYSFLSDGMPVGIIPFVNDSTTISGRIVQINPVVDNGGMIKVKAEFRNNRHLIDGMNVKVVIRKPVPGRLVVPKEAMVIRQGRDVIFIRQDSLAIWRYVTVEYENSTSIAVKDTPDGIHTGDLVIVSGNVNLAHETVVREQ